VRFTETRIPGVVLVEPEPSADDRGFFARVWCGREFPARGLSGGLAQCSRSYNRRRGTLRGMHFQAPPDEEEKLVVCLRGAIHDVALDLRPNSRRFREWTAHELTADNRLGLYIPAGCAHGFQTLTDDAEVLYFISAYHAAPSARGVRWDDPAFGIRWPIGDPILSDRDRTYPDFVS
jgi:dTDP-4-dehydrorhamnose 3,5-epimerase